MKEDIRDCITCVFVDRDYTEYPCRGCSFVVEDGTDMYTSREIMEAEYDLKVHLGFDETMIVEA